MYTVLRAVCGAIARHHTSQASEHGTVHLTKTPGRRREALRAAHQGSAWSYDLSLLLTHVSSRGDLDLLLPPTQVNQTSMDNGHQVNWRLALLHHRSCITSWLTSVLVDCSKYPHTESS